MKTFLLHYFIMTILVSLIPNFSQAQGTDAKLLDLNQLSEQFISNIKNNGGTNEIRAQLYGLSLEELESGLTSDDEKLAFWLNIYNGYIQVILSENPDKYKDRREFFKKEQVPIAGRLVSFSKIEHGIIRKSQWELGLGYIRKWFPNKFERKLRVDERDYRIHFALNCGAKDCPPVAIYEADRLDEQLKESSETYLQRTSEYNPEKREVAVTSLFKWFRGDFGCKSGIKDILKEFDIIPETKNVDIVYKDYDWTLDLDNWTEL